MSSKAKSMRWDPYVLATDAEFSNFWREHLSTKERDVLFVVGRGFDVRASEACTKILACGGNGQRNAWLIAFSNGLVDSETRKKLTAENQSKYENIFGEENITPLDVNLSTNGRQSATSRNVVNALRDVDTLRKYTDVIVDISAMPRMVAMTAISTFIHLLDKLFKEKGVDVNLHVTASESVSSDRAASSASLSDSVTSVVGFSGRLNSEVDEHIPRVWFPILGEDQSARLSLIRQELRPDEICPVVPFPSRNSRRGDQIVDEYRQILFDEFQVEPKNILHASEYNPFEAYRQLHGAIDRYRDSLSELGGCKAFVSPLSSKLLSIGALLACYDHRAKRGTQSDLHVGMPYVETATYGEPTQSITDGMELYSMWIRGEWER